MDLYLLRHTDAGQPTYNEDDSARQLTPQGEEEGRKVAEAFASSGTTFDIILSSPYARANQTAALIADKLGITDKLLVEESLAPGCTLEEVMDLIEKYDDKTKIMIVGHEPDLGRIAGALLLENEPRPFAKGEWQKIELYQD